MVAPSPRLKILKEVDMRSIVLSSLLAFALATSAQAADKPAAEKPAKAEKAEKAAPAKAEKKPAAGEVTLAGDMTCGKCSLKETAKCQNVLKVTDAGKE